MIDEQEETVLCKNVIQKSDHGFVFFSPLSSKTPMDIPDIGIKMLWLYLYRNIYRNTREIYIEIPKSGLGSSSFLQGIKPRSPTLQAYFLLAESSRKSKNTGVGSLSLL